VLGVLTPVAELSLLGVVLVPEDGLPNPVPELEVDPPVSTSGVLPKLEVELPNPLPVEIGLPNPVLLLEFEPPMIPVLVPEVELLDPPPVLVPEIEPSDVPIPALFWAETGRARDSTAKLSIPPEITPKLTLSKFKVTVPTLTTLAESKFMIKTFLSC